MAFLPKTLDYTVSPYTGLTRQSWIEAGEYLLEGVFQNIAHFEDPVVMPRKETKVTYPHSADAVWEFKAEAISTELIYCFLFSSGIFGTFPIKIFLICLSMFAKIGGVKAKIMEILKVKSHIK